MLIGSTIGSGIFRSPAGIADKLPGPLPLMSVWVAGGLFALCGALTLAELSGAFPETGGAYVFIREGWGRLPAFLFGWSELVLIRAASLGAISTTFAEYLLRVLGYDPAVAPYTDYVHYVAAVAIALTATFNYVGVRWGSLVQNLTTLAKYGGLLFIIAVAFCARPAADRRSLHAGRARGLVPHRRVRTRARVGALGVRRMGRPELRRRRGEGSAARRCRARSSSARCAVIAIYLLANLAYLAVMPVDEIRHSKLVAADVAQRLIGAPGVVFVATTVMLSTFGTLNGTLLTSPRVFFAMADDGLFFRRSRRCIRSSARRTCRSCSRRCSASCSCCCAPSSSSPIPSSRRSCRSTRSPSRRSSSCGSGADYDPPFRTPLYPVVPALFILATLFLLGNAILDAYEPVADARGAGDHSGRRSRSTTSPFAHAPQRPERTAPLAQRMTDKHDLPGLRRAGGHRRLQVPPGDRSDPGGARLVRLDEPRRVGRGGGLARAPRRRQRAALRRRRRRRASSRSSTRRRRATSLRSGSARSLYATVFLVEGIGLWRGKKWAEYLTIGVTASLLPVEVMALVHRVTLVRVATLVINTARDRVSASGSCARGAGGSERRSSKRAELRADDQCGVVTPGARWGSAARFACSRT